MRSFSLLGRTAFFHSFSPLRTLFSLRTLSLAGAYGLLSLLALGGPALAQAPTLANSSFETPTPSGTGLYAFQYNPTGGSWTFSGDSGIQAPGSAWFGGASNGSQSAYLQGAPGTTLGSISQSVYFAATGSYTVTFQAAQRTQGAGQGLVVQIQPVQVSVDGTAVGGTLTPASTSYGALTSASFTISAAGWHTIALAATDSSNGDKTTLVDQVTISTATPPTAVLSINAGGGAAGAFSADGAFSGGSTYTTGSSIDTSAVSNPAPQSVYQSERYGNSFSYTLSGLTAGSAYVVRLHFAELYWTSAGSRVFNVSINGASALSNFDIFTAAGGTNRATTEDLPATADGSGDITVSFTTVSDNAKVDGIEVFSPVPIPPSAPTGLTATAGNGSVSLSWTAPTGTGVTYNVYRGTAAGGESATPVASGLTATSYTDTGLTNGTAYFYKVKAVNTAGTSGASNEGSATPFPAGTGTGLLGSYFDDNHLLGLTLTRTDPQVNFNWSATSPDPLLSPLFFSVVWSGQVQAPVTGSYTFTTTSDDGVRLWVNHQLLINDWTLHGSTQDNAAISLTAGQKYAVQMEYFQGDGQAVAQLAWSYPGQATQIIPTSQLYTGPLATGFLLSASPATLNLTAGATGASALTIAPTGGFHDTVVLTGSALPTGVSAWFYPVVATTSGSTLFVQESAGATPGTYPVTVTATDSTTGAIIRTAVVSVVVN